MHYTEVEMAQRSGLGVVRLREVIEADLPVFFEHQRDPEASRMAGFPTRETDAFMAHWASVLADEACSTRTVLVGGRVAGNLGCFGPPGEREVCYWLGKDIWGQGVATQALTMFLAELPSRPLYAHVAPHNIASRRVLEKCGFVLISRQSDAAGQDGPEDLTFILDD